MFHPLCYDNGKGFIEENEVNDYQKMIRIQINEFGQVPKQIFKEPHPKKFSNQIRDLNPFGNNSSYLNVHNYIRENYAPNKDNMSFHSKFLRINYFLQIK